MDQWEAGLAVTCTCESAVATANPEWLELLRRLCLRRFRTAEFKKRPCRSPGRPRTPARFPPLLVTCRQRVRTRRLARCQALSTNFILPSH